MFIHLKPPILYAIIHNYRYGCISPPELIHSSKPPILNTFENPNSISVFPTRADLYPPAQ